MTVNQVLMVTLKTAKTYYNCNGTVFFATNKKMVGKQLIFSTTLFYIWETVVNDVFLVCLSVFDVLIHSNSLKSDHLQWMGGCLLTITNRYTMQTEEHFSFLFWRARDHYNHYRRTNVSVQEHWSLVPFFLYIFTFWPPGTNM